MIVGVGTDLVGVPRFAAVLRRTPGVADRVFTAAERLTSSGRARSTESLAARFAAKEAAAKAIGAPVGYRFVECEVSAAASGRPELHVSGLLGRHAQRLGVTRWHVSLTHDAELAAATVIAEAV